MSRNNKDKCEAFKLEDLLLISRGFRGSERIFLRIKELFDLESESF